MPNWKTHFVEPFIFYKTFYQCVNQINQIGQQSTGFQRQFAKIPASYWSAISNRRDWEQLHQLLKIQGPSSINQDTTGSANQQANRSTNEEPRLLLLVDHVAKLIEENKNAVKEVQKYVQKIFFIIYIRKIEGCPKTGSPKTKRLHLYECLLLAQIHII